jgi:hypothetical protein
LAHLFVTPRQLAKRRDRRDMDDLDVLLTEKQYAGIRQESERTIQRERESGTGCPFVKLGRAVRYRKRDISRFIEQHIRQSTSESQPGTAVRTRPDRWSQEPMGPRRVGRPRKMAPPPDAVKKPPPTDEEPALTTSPRHNSKKPNCAAVETAGTAAAEEAATAEVEVLIAELPNEKDAGYQFQKDGL